MIRDDVVQLVLPRSLGSSVLETRLCTSLTLIGWVKHRKDAPDTIHVFIVACVSNVDDITSTNSALSEREDLHIDGLEGPRCIGRLRADESRGQSTIRCQQETTSATGPSLNTSGIIFELLHHGRDSLDLSLSARVVSRKEPPTAESVLFQLIWYDESLPALSSPLRWAGVDPHSLLAPITKASELSWVSGHAPRLTCTCCVQQGLYHVIPAPISSSAPPPSFHLHYPPPPLRSAACRRCVSHRLPRLGLERAPRDTDGGPSLMGCSRGKTGAADGSRGGVCRLAGRDRCTISGRPSRAPGALR